MRLQKCFFYSCYNTILKYAKKHLKEIKIFTKTKIFFFNGTFFNVVILHF